MNEVESLGEKELLKETQRGKNKWGSWKALRGLIKLLKISKTHQNDDEALPGSGVSHLENVCLQYVMAKLHGLLAVQLTLLSREHEGQESVPIPRTRNTKAGNKDPVPRTVGSQV